MHLAACFFLALFDPRRPGSLLLASAAEVHTRNVAVEGCMEPKSEEAMTKGKYWKGCGLQDGGGSRVFKRL